MKAYAVDGGYADKIAISSAYSEQYVDTIGILLASNVLMRMALPT